MMALVIRFSKNRRSCRMLDDLRALPWTQLSGWSSCKFLEGRGGRGQAPDAVVKETRLSEEAKDSRAAGRMLPQVSAKPPPQPGFHKVRVDWCDSCCAWPEVRCLTPATTQGSGSVSAARGLLGSKPERISTSFGHVLRMAAWICSRGVMIHCHQSTIALATDMWADRRQGTSALAKRVA
ncbi:hypothetical protein C0Q70_02546 [Pomacea canaliculata]|uniref:Uncharacterized protein n=1 Tax=Pomacea canaliculata TaxID=400727 RepID=A0A2T7PQ76_POMCA|nr:hypothetical protein C0Q70_02546 [Pomacea canaliculata]